MSKKHNCKHARSTSHYKDRLAKRGVAASKMSNPRLEDGKLADASR